MHGPRRGSPVYYTMWRARRASRAFARISAGAECGACSAGEGIVILPERGGRCWTAHPRGLNHCVTELRDSGPAELCGVDDGFCRLDADPDLVAAVESEFAHRRGRDLGND